MWRFTVLTNGLVVLTLKAFLAPVANVGLTSSYIIGDSRLNMAYTDLGDLNIGGLFSVFVYDKETTCGEKMSRSAIKEIRAMEILAHTIRQVNANDSLLPGIKLGFVFLDFCSNVQAAMVQACRLLPRSDPSDYTPSNRSDYLMSFRVVGLLGTNLDHVSKPISVLLSGVGLPVVSFWDGGDAGNFHDEQATFLHLSTRRNPVVDAMIQYMKVNNWLLASFITENNEEGFYLFKYTKRIAEREGICISLAQFVTATSDFDMVFKKLIESGARIGLVLISTNLAKTLAQTTEWWAVSGKILWLLTDSWLYLLEKRPVHGVLIFTHFSIGVSQYHVERKILDENPWFLELLRQEDCIGDLCIKYLLLKIDSMFTIDEINIRDVLMVYVHGLDNLIRDRCHLAEGSNATLCFENNSQYFMQYLKAATFMGSTRLIVEGSSGKKVDQEEINIYKDFTQENQSGRVGANIVWVAKFKTKDNSLSIFHNITFEWATFQVNELNIGTVCKITCSPYEARVKRNICCHSCRRCQDDERIIHNQAACEKCPIYHWPAFVDGNKSLCEEIPLKTFQLTDPVSLATLACDLAVLLLVVFVVVKMLYYSAIINRCTHMGLIFIELVSIVCGLASVPLLVSYPATWKCNLAHGLFVFSFSSLYLLLFLDSVSLYRQCDDIVDDQLMSWTSVTYQLAFVVSVICLEITIFIVLFFLYPVGAMKSHLIGEKWVEFTCKIPSSHIIVFLLFAIPLLMISLLFSLKSQNDTIGFHQCRYISMFYVISLITWIVFMPSYFTAIRSTMRSYYLLFVLIGNHATALLLNYYPEYFLKMIVRRKESVQLFKRLLSSDKSQI